MPHRARAVVSRTVVRGDRVVASAWAIEHWIFFQMKVLTVDLILLLFKNTCITACPECLAAQINTVSIACVRLVGGTDVAKLYRIGDWS